MRALAFTFLTLISFVAVCQEAAETSASGHASWSDQTKWIILAIFAVFNVILVLRTFRNKPEA